MKNLNNNDDNFYNPSIIKLSNKNNLITLLLCLFLGYLGVHRFYVGKFSSGLTMIILCLLSFLFIPAIILIIWIVVDFITIAAQKFKDSDDAELRFK